MLYAVLLFESYFEGAEQMVRFNGTLSPRIPVPYGVRQGSIIGPSLFIALMSGVYRYCLEDLQDTYMVGYADDNNSLSGAQTYNELRQKMELTSARLVSFSANNKLAINPSKTQIMANPDLGEIKILDSVLIPGSTLDLLGTIFEVSGRFTKHNDRVDKDLRRRVGRIRRLSSHIPRGQLLREIGNAIVIGKANCGAWVTREAHLPDNCHSSTPHVGQVPINDLARILTGHTRKEHIPVSTLIDKANVPTLNEIVIKRAALEAWKALNGGVLSHALIRTSSSTRATSDGLVSARTDSLADTNMKRCWNICPQLRAATTLNQAKNAAKKLATENRNL